MWAVTAHQAPPRGSSREGRRPLPDPAPQGREQTPTVLLITGCNNKRYCINTIENVNWLPMLWSRRMVNRFWDRAWGRFPRTEYSIWYGIVRRWCNPRDRGFPSYGGRGIGVSARWR